MTPPTPEAGQVATELLKTLRLGVMATPDLITAHDGWRVAEIVKAMDTFAAQQVAQAWQTMEPYLQHIQHCEKAADTGLTPTEVKMSHVCICGLDAHRTGREDS